MAAGPRRRRAGMWPLQNSTYGILHRGCSELVLRASGRVCNESAYILTGDFFGIYLGFQA